LLQHLAKHNAFHRAVENAAKDIGRRVKGARPLVLNRFVLF
jgi:hypothetical protein